MGCSTEGQLLFIGFPEPSERIIWGPGKAMSHAPQLWFRHDGGWLRQEWAGQFPDGSPRPPWLDALFDHLWKTEGPDAAKDKSRYDLQEVTMMLEAGPEPAADRHGGRDQQGCGAVREGEDVMGLHIVPVPCFSWPRYYDAGYYGYAHAVCIGYWLIFWGKA